jgi:hypothetical protein
MSEFDIIIRNQRRPISSRLKTLARPRKRKDDYGRRRGEPGIQFYDLAQVNTGTAESPVWEDHPILFTPAYTATRLASGGDFLGVGYEFEPFGPDQFQAYTDMFFSIAPVTDWSRTFKRVEYDFFWNTNDVTADPPVTSFGQMPDIFLMYDPYDIHLADTAYLTDVRASDAAGKRTFLNANGFAWVNDKTVYRGLDELTGMYPTPNPSPNWFGFSTGQKDRYKITTVNDPDAADVGTVKPTGNLDVFLMPQIGFWAAATATTIHPYGPDAQDILGMHYQVQPRQFFPRFVDPFWPQPSGPDAIPDTTADPSGRKSAYLAYQQTRAGVRASSWSTPDSGVSVIETPTDPAAWSGGTYRTATLSRDDSTNFFYNLGEDGDGDPVRYRTLFSVSGDWFVNDQPFLVAVVRSGATFYYVWNFPSEGFSYSALQSNLQGRNYMLRQSV